MLSSKNSVSCRSYPRVLDDDKSTLQVPLHHLKELHLTNDFCHVFELLNHLEPPDKMNDLKLLMLTFRRFTNPRAIPRRSGSTSRRAFRQWTRAFGHPQLQHLPSLHGRSTQMWGPYGDGVIRDSRSGYKRGPGERRSREVGFRPHHAHPAGRSQRLTYESSHPALREAMRRDVQLGMLTPR